MNRRLKLINEIADQVHRRILSENEVDLHDEFYGRKPGELQKFLSQSAKALEDFASRVDDYFMGLSTRVQLKKEINNVEEVLTDNAPGSLFLDIDHYINTEQHGRDAFDEMFPDADMFRRAADWCADVSKQVIDSDEDYQEIPKYIALIVAGLHELTSHLNRRR